MNVRTVQNIALSSEMFGIRAKLPRMQDARKIRNTHCVKVNSGRVQVQWPQLVLLRQPITVRADCWEPSHYPQKIRATRLYPVEGSRHDPVNLGTPTLSLLRARGIKHLPLPMGLRENLVNLSTQGVWGSTGLQNLFPVKEP